MSFPVQLPSAAQFSTGHGGWVAVEPSLFRVTWNGIFREDLSSYLIDMSVTHDTSRTASNWVLDATITYDGWLRLQAFSDWLAPTLTVTYADGTTKTKQLGHYLVLDSPEHREEIGGTVRIDARDALWVLNMQGIGDVYIAPTGTSLLGSPVDFGPEIQRFIDEAVVPGAPEGSKLRSSIPRIPSIVGLDGPIYDEGTRRLEAINGLLQWGANFFNLDASYSGVLTARKLNFLRGKTPIRRWLANPPDGPFSLGSLPTPIDPSPAERVSPIAEAIESQPFTADLVEKVMVIGGILNPDPIVGEASIGTTFTSSSLIAPTVKGSIKRVFSPYATSQAMANDIAAGILEQILTENTSLTLMVGPDPEFVAMHDVVELGIWDAVKSSQFPNGREIANGRYVVKRVRYGMMPESPLMRIDVSSLATFDPVATP